MSPGLWAIAPAAVRTFAVRFGSIAGGIEDAILSLTTSIWIYLAVFGVTIVDGIFPPIPSESVVIASATTWEQTGRPLIWAIWIAAAMGAWCGDQIAYSVGRAINVRSIPFLRGHKARGTLDWAEHALEHRGTAFILAARFIPVGRVAVNLTAGALRYPRRRFMMIDGIAALLWATYGCALGVWAGNLVHDSLLLSIGIGVLGGIALGYLVDRILGRLGLQPTVLPPVEELPEFHFKRESDGSHDSTTGAAQDS
jgi:membrane protein DedA with SNARE-associated domain